MKKFFLLLSALLAFNSVVTTSCKDDKDDVKDGGESSQVVNPTPKEQWGPTAKGSDFTVPQLPDLYVNYWEYTWSLEKNANLALCVKGSYPNCRYFSFSIYDDAYGSVICGMSDYEIKPDNGCVNPFLTTSKANNTFTVYIVPSTVPDEKLAQLEGSNVIKVADSIKNACMIIRQYLGVDEYGGVDMPAIRAYDLSTMKEVAAPLRAKSNVYVDPKPFQTIWSDTVTDCPFMLAPRGSFYPNNATNYLYTRTALDDDQVLYYSFIPAPHPSRVEENLEAPCRYWSMCFGTQVDTRSYYSVYDEQANVPDGEKVTFVVCLKQNPQLEAIETAVNAAKAAGKYINLIVWDRERPSYFPEKPIGNCFTIMYRNILPNKNWEHSMAHMTETPYGDTYHTSAKDPDHMQADKALGDYGPRGKKVPTSEFLELMK